MHVVDVCNTRYAYIVLLTFVFNCKSFVVTHGPDEVRDPMKHIDLRPIQLVTSVGLAHVIVPHRVLPIYIVLTFMLVICLPF